MVAPVLKSFQAQVSHCMFTLRINAACRIECGTPAVQRFLQLGKS